MVCGLCIVHLLAYKLVWSAGSDMARDFTGHMHGFLIPVSQSIIRAPDSYSGCLFKMNRFVHDNRHICERTNTPESYLQPNSIVSFNVYPCNSGEQCDANMQCLINTYPASLQSTSHCNLEFLRRNIQHKTFEMKCDEMRPNLVIVGVNPWAKAICMNREEYEKHLWSLQHRAEDASGEGGEKKERWVKIWLADGQGCIGKVLPPILGDSGSCSSSQDLAIVKGH